MNKQTLAILFGGCNSEYEVSLQSASAVIEAVDPLLYDVLLLGITRTGQWLYFPGGPDAVRADTWQQDPGCAPAALSPSREDHGVWIFFDEAAEKRTIDIAFPVLHGKNGEDGTIQGLLELAGIPFVGCGSLASALCMDKDVAQRLAMQAGFCCPRSVTLCAGDADIETLCARAREELWDVFLPWFIKPASEGSSFGVVRIENESQLKGAVTNAFRYGDKILVQEGIDGFEVGCAVLGDHRPILGRVDAISLQKGFFDYHEKYHLETAQILLPAPIDEATAAQVQAMALALYRLMGCRGFARVDMFLARDGRIVFNEINTIPGLTPHSRYPGMLAAVGIPFPQMIQRLLESAVAA